MEIFVKLDKPDIKTHPLYGNFVILANGISIILSRDAVAELEKDIRKYKRDLKAAPPAVIEQEKQESEG